MSSTSSEVGPTPTLGGYGVFRPLANIEPDARGDVVAELDELGYGAVWLGHATVEEAAPLVGAAPRITVATGIHSIWRQEAADAARHFARLEEEHPERFLLGLGVSHPQAVSGYQRPYTAMAAYLDELDDPATFVPPRSRMLAALGPRMIRLARERTAGAFPYLVTAEQVAETRASLGESSVLAPELGVVTEDDPARARKLAREALSVGLQLTNYRRNWLRAGFTEEDLADGGSDRLVDALFAWGDDARIRERLAEFRAAGADHVALQVFDGSPTGELPHRGWREVARLLD